jgi:hypothetical protein
LLVQVQYGRIENVTVRGGEPVFDDGLRVFRTVKLAGRPERRTCQAPPMDGQHVPRETLALLSLIERVGDGCIHRIEVAHGVPLFTEVVELPPAA